MAEAFDDQVADMTVKCFIVGVGARLESIVRKWALRPDIAQRLVQGLDTSDGQYWQTSPRVLHEYVRRLFANRKPGAILALEAIARPAFQVVVEQAKHSGLGMWISRKATPELRAARAAHEREVPSRSQQDPYTQENERPAQHAVKVKHRVSQRVRQRPANLVNRYWTCAQTLRWRNFALKFWFMVAYDVIRLPAT